MRLHTSCVVALVGCVSLFSAAAEAGVVGLYWTDPWTPRIRRTEIASVQDIVSLVGVGLPHDIAIDAVGGKVYWLMGDVGIQRANLDGTCVEVLVTTNPQKPFMEIALDVPGGKMYWTEGGGSTNISRANLDGTSIEDVVVGLLPSAIAIAVDSVGGKLYFGSGSIRRANLEIPVGETAANRSDIETLVGQFANSLALDTADGKMYWLASVGGAKTLSRANLDGSNIEVIRTPLPNAKDIALDPAGGKVYWTEHINCIGCSTQRILRANKAPPHGAPEVVLANLSGPLGLALLLAPISLTAGDMNGDGLINGIDVQLFVDKLLGCP